MTVGEYLVIAFRDAWHVVHSGTPAAGPVGAVLPGTVEFPPLGISHESRENPVKPVDVSELLVIQ